MQTCPRETQRDSISYPGFCIALNAVAELVDTPFMMSLTTAAIEKVIPIGFPLTQMAGPGVAHALRFRLRQ